MLPSLILNETTLFYLNLSTTAPDTSNTYNAIKKWTSHVAKTNRSSKSSGSASISTLVPSKRTTSSSSAVVSKTRSQPEKKKIKLDNQDVATSTMILEEDEAVEREAALSSPIKGKKRLNNKVCRISHRDGVLTRSVDRPLSRWKISRQPQSVVEPIGSIQMPISLTVP
jgi:hypothetical protein